ncbi:MAG: helix-turn-helix domain-containing protein, partial [Sedimentisphaerales bacterium]
MPEIKEMEDIENKHEQAVSPGNRLRQAREQSGLSRKEVATHLKLSQEKIEALERGEVDQLAAPVFVAGYLRAYAKLVGLPEEEIISDFKGLAEMEAPSIDPSASPATNNYGRMESSTIIKWVKKNDWSKQVFLGGVVTVLAVILFVFFVDDGSSIRTLTENMPLQEEANVSFEKIEELKAEEKIEKSNT